MANFSLSKNNLMLADERRKRLYRNNEWDGQTYDGLVLDIIDVENGYQRIPITLPEGTKKLIPEGESIEPFTEVSFSDDVKVEVYVSKGSLAFRGTASSASLKLPVKRPSVMNEK